MDGGRIIYLLDTGALKDLRFCSYAFENSSQGKFMLNIIFGYSKYYVDSLSENVRRGLRTKVRSGWRPNLAPIGYRNCKETGTIVPDGEHFKAVRAMFDLLLTGSYTIPQIHHIVCEEWGYTTPVLKTRGGKQDRARHALSNLQQSLLCRLYPLARPAPSGSARAGHLEERIRGGAAAPAPPADAPSETARLPLRWCVHLRRVRL